MDYRGATQAGSEVQVGIICADTASAHPWHGRRDRGIGKKVVVGNDSTDGEEVGY
jgi:hypothetical protein